MACSRRHAQQLGKESMNVPIVHLSSITCHFECSDPAFSCARSSCAGSRREKSLFLLRYGLLTSTRQMTRQGINIHRTRRPQSPTISQVQSSINRSLAAPRTHQRRPAFRYFRFGRRRERVAVSLARLADGLEGKRVAALRATHYPARHPGKPIYFRGIAAISALAIRLFRPLGHSGKLLETFRRTPYTLFGGCHENKSV